MVRQIIRNFIVANVCAVFPMMGMAFGWMPDQVKIAVRGGANAPSIVVDDLVLQGEAWGEWEEGTVWRYYLREGMKWKELAFLFPEGKGATDVGRVDLQRWKLILLGKAGTALELTDENQNEWRFVNPKFDSVRITSRGSAWGLAGLEILLWGMACLFAKRGHGEKWERLLPSSALVALALAVLMQVALPIQSYLANQSSYPFSFGALAGSVALRFSLLFVLATTSISLLVWCFGRWVLGAVSAFVACVYLESGILSAWLPDLNGDWWFFQNRTRGLWDAAVWAGVFVLFAALHPVIKKHYGFVAVCLSVMVGASMFDVKREEEADTSKLVVHDFSSIETVIRNVTYSTKRNVLVFVIDSLEREIAHAIMEDPMTGSELRGKFQGFTEYLDNVGAGNNSLIGVANLFTGNYPENMDDLFDYFASVYSSQSALVDYLDEDTDIYLATEALGYGYCNRQDSSKRKTHTSVPARGCFNIPGQDGQGWTLSGITRFRWLPFAAKAKYAYLAERFMPEPDFNLHEWVVYPFLKGAETQPEKKTLVFVHTRGVHSPILYNREGKRLSQGAVGDAACQEIGIFIMRQLADMFDAYREKGIYDNSLIVVLADHGTQGDKQLSSETLPKNGRPFLWVKPNDSHHDFKSSNLPTSHARVSALLRAASRRTLSESDISELLLAPIRKYRNLHGGVGPEWEDWIVHSDGRIEHGTGTLKMGTGKQLGPLALSRRYSLDKSAMVKNRIDVEFQNTMFWDTPTLLYDTPNMAFRFRVPEAGKRYSLHLALKFTNAGQEDKSGTCMKFRQANRDADWQRCPLDYHVSFVLHGLVPVQDGLVEIEGEREPGFLSRVHFSQLMLQEENP